MMSEQKPPTLTREIIHYLQENKRWWLLPIVLVLALLAVVALLSGLAPALPFIYTLF